MLYHSANYLNSSMNQSSESIIFFRCFSVSVSESLLSLCGEDCADEPNEEKQSSHKHFAYVDKLPRTQSDHFRSVVRIGCLVILLKSEGPSVVIYRIVENTKANDINSRDYL